MTTSFVTPLLLIVLQNAFKKAVVSSPNFISKWTPLEEKHVSRYKYLLCLVFAISWVVKNGKSIPTVLKDFDVTSEWLLSSWYDFIINLIAGISFRKIIRYLISLGKYLTCFIFSLLISNASLSMNWFWLASLFFTETISPYLRLSCFTLWVSRTLVNICFGQPF